MSQPGPAPAGGAGAIAPPAVQAAAPARELPRTIGFWGATAVMVGIIIGSGIFKTPASIAQEMSSPTLILLMWAAGGLISLCGAFTYAELATMFPQSGGVYVFLREGLGRSTAFVFGWTYMLISKPLAAAGIAVIFAEHLNQLLGTSVPPPLWTCAALIVLTAICARGTGLSTGVAGLLTVVKVAALLAIVVLAAGLGHVTASILQPVAEAKPVDGAVIVAVMAAILWTYDGWSDVGAIAGEVRQPQRMLPRIYFAGTAFIILLYVLVNTAYFGVVSLEEMRSPQVRESGNVAPLVADRLLGPGFGWVVLAIVIVSTLGSTHGAILTGARITFAQARDGLMFRFLAAVGPRRHTPHVALWSQCLLSCIAALWLQTFESLAEGFVFTMWIFYGLAGAAIFILRVRRPHAARPYRCWGYPVVPAIFIGSAVAMTYLMIAAKPQQTLTWVAVLVVGWPVYWVWRRWTSPSSTG